MIVMKGRPAEWLDVPSLVREKARRHGDAPFCCIEGRSLTYRELDERSDRVAAQLAARGVVPGDRVASLMFNCVEQVLAWIGTSKLGAIWAPLNGSLVGDDLVHTVRDTGAAVLVVDGDGAARLRVLPAEMLRALQVFEVVEDAPSGRFARFEELLAPGTAPAGAPIGPGTPAMILYSGGTTGLPKGVVLPQFALVCAAYRYREVMRATPADRHYSTLPLFHAGGVELGILGPLLSDMRTTLDRRFSASTYWQRVKDTGSTILDPLGTMMTVLVQRPADPIDRAHGARISVGVTGQVPETVPAEFERRFRIEVVDIYGNTESGGAMLTSNQSALRTPRLVGHPNGWSTIGILDDNDDMLPAGAVGRIAMRPTIPFTFMLGYHNNPAKTVETWRNLWLHTGDLGRLDEAGNLYFVGRQAHWMRRRGENISAHEVEGILAAHPNVAECIVTGVPSELGEEDVKAWIIARDAAPDPAALARWCIERMAPFKVPRWFEFVTDFPRSAAKQEVERAKLRARGNDAAWDREAHMGRLSAQAATRPRSDP